MKPGAHLPNDGRLTDAELWLVSLLPLVKGLVRLDVDWGEVDWRRLVNHLRPDCTVILRLYFPGKLPPGEFVHRADRKLRPILEILTSFEVLIQIHNEPNHVSGKEGWGKSVDQARDFARWYQEVRAGLRSAGYVGRLGFPGLAVGQGNHGERIWAIMNAQNARSSGWVGCHCYWQRPQELDDPGLGGNWRWYRERWPNKRLYVVEAGNSSCDNPSLPQVTPERQTAEYLEWCRLAAAGGVAGVAFYMLGGSREWEGFRLHPETVIALSRFELNPY